MVRISFFSFDIRQCTGALLVTVAAAGLAGCASSHNGATFALASATAHGTDDVLVTGSVPDKAKAPAITITEKRTTPAGGGYYKIGKPYKIAGRRYRPAHDPDYKRTGIASWYGTAFHGRKTANGEVFDMNALSAAHTTMPLPSYARVTNLENGRSLIVRVNDRGPYSRGRVIDLSRRAAGLLDFQHAGTAKVRVEYIGKAPLDGRDHAYLAASFRAPGRNNRTATAAKSPPRVEEREVRTAARAMSPPRVEEQEVRTVARAEGGQQVVRLGVYARLDAVTRLKRALAKYGDISHNEIIAKDRVLRSVNLRVSNVGVPIDTILAAARSAGAVGARAIIQ